MNSFLSFSVILSLVLLPAILLFGGVEAQTCEPSENLIGVESPPGECNTDFDADCCKPGEPYQTFTCSPTDQRAVLTINSFEEGGDGGGASACDEQFHSNDTPVVALSTGWFNDGERCQRSITIEGNGRSVVALVVDECDSTMGCDEEHAYQPPCRNNIVDASAAVWEALGVPREDWGELDITWYDA
ncbi:hypothetical protein C5167_036612 [Papaver somniferum]|uniref:Uncharacterized protein n=1 Tax=Papaver somniferum TaxID=3469 RepID=A0A4Y7I826_PAPSO|nr:putative ripening-related protein 1 [Papaver somniferum]RZC43658.1 hypothetical protein C5167_036612 [Papaver somniferum]